jgi:hypothetical protein
VFLLTLDQGGAEAKQGCSFTRKPKNVKGSDSFTRGLDGKGGTDTGADSLSPCEQHVLAAFAAQVSLIDAFSEEAAGEE